MRIRKLLTITTFSMLLMSYSLDNPGSAHSPENGKGKSEPKHGTKMSMTKVKPAKETKVRMAKVRPAKEPKVRSARKHGKISSVPATPSTPSTPPTPPTTSTVVQPPSNSLNALAFSGVDPTGAHDSTQGLQTALNAASANGVALYLPPGTYSIHSILTVSTSLLASNATINVTSSNGGFNVTGEVDSVVGGLSGTQRLNFYSANLAPTTTGNALFSVNGVYNLTLQYIDFNQGQGYGALDVTNATVMVVTDCNFPGAPVSSNPNVQTFGVAASATTVFTLQNCIFNNLDQAVTFETSQSGNNSVVTIAGNTLYGRGTLITAGNNSLTNINRNYINESYNPNNPFYGSAVLINGCSNTTITNNIIYGGPNAINAIVYSGSTDIYSNNTIGYTSSTAIDIDVVVSYVLNAAAIVTGNQISYACQSSPQAPVIEVDGNGSVTLQNNSYAGPIDNADYFIYVASTVNTKSDSGNTTVPLLPSQP